MQQNDLTILLIDRDLKEDEHPVKDVFKKYGFDYGLLVFPPEDDDPETRIQVVFFDYNQIKYVEEIFHTVIDYDGDDMPEFFDFDLTEIELDVFYDMLAQQYKISIEKLTEVENKKA